jgi:hypothetical protein
MAGEQMRSLLAVIGGLAAAGLWLTYGPHFIGALVGAADGPGAEAVFTVAVFAPLLALALAGGAVSGTPAWVPGGRPGAAILRGAALGLGGLLLAIGYAALAGTLHSAGSAASATLLLGSIVIAVQVAAEEALFRGWLQPTLARTTGTPAATGLLALSFAALHALGGVGVTGFANMLLGGVLFGVLAAETGGVVAPFAAHFAWNASEQLLFGLDPNPATGAFGAVIDLDLIGAASWGGSEVGLNDSWAMAFALAAVLVLAISTRRSAPGVDPVA